MKTALRLGQISGIKISAHWTFVALLAWVAWSHLAQGYLAAMVNVVLVVATFGCILLHELGHVFAARQCGISTHDITLLPIGGLARLERVPRRPEQELFIALAGPAVNVFIVGLLLPLAALLTQLTRVATPSLQAPLALAIFLVSRLMWTNVALTLFNLIPAFPMDGGRVLRAWLARTRDYGQATAFAKRLGQAFAGGFALVGLFWNPLLLLVAAFVAWAGEVEYRHVLRESRDASLWRDTIFGGSRPVHTLMATTVGPNGPQSELLGAVVCLGSVMRPSRSS